MSRTKPPVTAPTAASVSFFGRMLTARHFLTHRRKRFMFVGTAIACLLSLLWLQSDGLAPWLHSKSGAVLLGSVPAADHLPTPREDERDTDRAKTRTLVVNARPIIQAGPAFLKQQYTGIVVARRTTQLAAKSLGRVEQLTVELGDHVVSGQSLVRLDSQQLLAQRDVLIANLSAARALLTELKNGPRRQELEQSRARIDELQSRVEYEQTQLSRNERLDGSSSVSLQELDESRFRTKSAKAQLRSAMQADALLQEGTRFERVEAQQSTVNALQAQIKNIDIQLEDKQIVAPYAGHVQARLVDEGTIVTAGQPLLEIVESGELEIHVGLPDELAVRLDKPADDPSLVVSWGERRLNTRMARIAPAIDSATRTREVVLAVEGGEYPQPTIGSAVNVEIQIPIEVQGFWVPTVALTAGTRGLWGVFVAVPMVASELDRSSTASHTIAVRPVELLRSQGQWSEIRGPLDAQDLLVIDGTHRIIAGQAVRVSETVTEPTPF